MITTIKKFKKVLESSNNNIIITGGEYIGKSGIIIDTDGSENKEKYIQLNNGDKVWIAKEYIQTKENNITADFTNIGQDEDGNSIGNCKNCNGTGVLVDEHDCKDFVNTNETKEVDDKLADDIVIVDKDTLKPLDKNEYEITKIIDVINDPKEIKKIEEALGTSVNTDLNITNVTVGKLIYFTAMLKARNKSTSNPLGEIGVVAARIQQVWYGLGKLNQLKQRGQLFQ